MTATIVPDDLHAWRAEALQVTGLSGDAFGIAPDAPHKAGGGYHCGVQDIINIGEYPDGDYSTRQQRDRVGGNVACASDVGDDWPNGGRAAWLRYNNMLVHQMMAGDPALAALRAVNFSPDGTARKRYDSFHPEQGIIDSTDSVYMHTHHEWWRNTEGKRDACLARLTQIMRAAINNTPLEDEMEQSEQIAGNAAKPGRRVGDAFADLTNGRDWWYGKPTDTTLNPPPAGSRADLVFQFVTHSIPDAIKAIQAGQVSQDAVNVAVAAALQNPDVLAAIATAVADEQYRRQAQ